MLELSDIERSHLVLAEFLSLTYLRGSAWQQGQQLQLLQQRIVDEMRVLATKPHGPLTPKERGLEDALPCAIVWGGWGP